MSILDFDDTYKPPFNPRRPRKAEPTEEERLAELNNLGRDEIRGDFSDSPHLDY